MPHTKIPHENTDYYDPKSFTQPSLSLSPLQIMLDAKEKAVFYASF